MAAQADGLRKRKRCDSIDSLGSTFFDDFSELGHPNSRRCSEVSLGFVAPTRASLSPSFYHESESKSEGHEDDIVTGLLAEIRRREP